ncbi:unnamed protein product [Owenia fusiformis]|uniref:VWFA domain-containing protein n=1 Tax=Owenia fusiformis TaxID=6347 RepID=A0A8S4P6H2_OWEFU|nr:unnamed protein product [Owenia fusiformis]
MILNIAVLIFVACNIIHVNGDVNLMFVFDKSGSISVGSFELSKEVAIKIYEGLVAIEDNVLASALTFSVKPKIMFTADKYTPTSDPGVVDAINAFTMNPSKSGRRQSNTDKVLEMINEELERWAPNGNVFVVLFYDGVLFPRTAIKREEVIKMANDMEMDGSANILGVKLKNGNGNDPLGAKDLKRIASGDPEQNDVFPSVGGNLNAENKDEVAEAIVNKISGR